MNKTGEHQKGLQNTDSRKFRSFGRPWDFHSQRQTFNFPTTKRVCDADTFSAVKTKRLVSVLVLKLPPPCVMHSINAEGEAGRGTSTTHLPKPGRTSTTTKTHVQIDSGKTSVLVVLSQSWHLGGTTTDVTVQLRVGAVDFIRVWMTGSLTFSNKNSGSFEASLSIFQVLPLTFLLLGNHVFTRWCNRTKECAVDESLWWSRDPASICIKMWPTGKKEKLTQKAYPCRHQRTGLVSWQADQERPHNFPFKWKFLNGRNLPDFQIEMFSHVVTAAISGHLKPNNQRDTRFVLQLTSPQYEKFKCLQ